MILSMNLCVPQTAAQSPALRGALRNQPRVARNIGRASRATSFASGPCPS